jgi:mono/diheme cytochrome c family protein
MSGGVKARALLIVPITIVGLVILYFSHTMAYKAGVTTGRAAALAEAQIKAAGDVVDLRALARNTELSREGKALFKTNCTSCHGDNGEGNGPRAAGLNPPPRNYRKETFKFGNDIVSIFNTLRKGSAGTSMPSFVLLPPKDLFALAHYVRTLTPNPTPTTEEILAQLPTSLGAGDASVQGERIPIQFAMRRMAVTTAPQNMSTIDMSLPGAKIYGKYCAACHGQSGEGVQADLISVNPYVYVRTQSLANPSAPWHNNRDVFADLVTKGLPGRVMPGKGELTQQQIAELFELVRAVTE